MLEDNTHERIEELIDVHKHVQINTRGMRKIIKSKIDYENTKRDILAEVRSMEGNWVEHPRYGTGEIQKNYYTYERDEWRCVYQPHNMEDSVDVPLKPPLKGETNGIKGIIEVDIEIDDFVK